MQNIYIYIEGHFYPKRKRSKTIYNVVSLYIDLYIDLGQYNDTDHILAKRSLSSQV